MRKFNLKDVVELTGIAAIVASLVFVGYQLKQSQDIAMAETGFSVMNAQIELNNQLIEHSGVWIKGSAGEKLSEEESFIFEKLITNLNQLTFFSYINWIQLGSTSANIQLHAFAQMLHENPGAREAWIAMVASEQPYYALWNEPLESGSFNDLVMEILEMQDSM
jgi:hypothetical protein